MAYNYAHEDYLERKHNNRVEAMYLAAKTKGKSNPFTEVVSEVKTFEDNEATDKLFGWGKYANIETFLK